MKTKMLFFGAIFMLLVTNLYASHTHLYLEDTQTDPSFWYCSTEYDSLIIHKPENGYTHLIWETPDVDLIEDVDLVIVLSSDLNGHWCFYSEETEFIDFFIYFVDPAYEPANFEDLHICTFSFSRILDAQNDEYATYLWSTDQTTRTISVDAPGTYTVTITNTCGDMVFSKTITQNNPNAPNLGPDQEFCFGETTTLDPQSTDVTYTLWSTGSENQQLVVEESGTYWVHVEDVNGCNGRDTINVVINNPVDMQMHDVSFDTTTNKNMLRWCVDPMQSDITHVRGEVKNNLGQWIEIETVPYEQGYIIHWESTPQADYNEYRVIAIGECGEGNPSASHKSIWLTQFNEELQWENYYGNFIPTYYIIFARMIDNTIIQLGTIAAAPGSYLNHYPITENPDIVKYFVAFEHNCGAKDGVQYVFSNYYDPLSGVATTEVINFSLYPNPTSDQLNITLGYKRFQVEVSTMLGQVLLAEQNTKVLNVSSLPQGIYIISIIADGVKTNKMFTKH